ncbi:MAG: aspartyl protease family protein [Candidatus Sulfotelmatobacter sp.]
MKIFAYTAAAIILLTAVLPIFAAAYAQDSAETILNLNHAASGGQVWSGKSTLELRFSYAGQGLQGEADSVEDLRTGAFIETDDIGPAHQANGFDGSQAWTKDISGAITPEAGGDKRQLAVNEAYRDSEAWWRADRGGAKIEWDASKQADGHTYDVLTVTPTEGKSFEAWFDADTHLLARIVEMQQFLTTTIIYSDYRATDGVMIAHKVGIDDGSGPDGLQTQTLLSAKFLPVRSESAYRMRSGVPNDTMIEGEATQTTVPFELLNNHIYVNVSINNKGPFRFQVDTGGHNILMPRTAKTLGLEVTGESPATGAGQETAVSGYAHVNEIKIGEAVIRNQEVFVLQFHPDAVEGFPGDGMIGFEVFRRLVTHIDYGKKTLTLIKPAAFQPPRDAVAIKFAFYDNVPQVDGSFEGLPGKFDIDTGSRTELNITKPFVDRYSLQEKSKGVIATDGWGVGGHVQSYVTRGSDLQLGGVNIRNVVASLAIHNRGSFSDPNFAGNVGSALLKRFDATFDYENQVMYLKRLPEPVADTGVFDRSGMWINAENGGFQVMSLTSGGPAENAGIKVGDVITAVDGIPVESGKLSEFRAELRDDSPGAVINLTIKNAGGSRVIPLTLRDQI